MPAWTPPDILRDLRAEWAIDRARLEAVLTRNISIGVLGGSISVGADLADVKHAYPNVLRSSHRLTVRNYAIRATGVAQPSFCLDAMVESLPDVLLVEFAANDGHYGHWHGLRSVASTAGAASHALDPLASMERLLRRLPVQTTVLLLYICAPEFARTQRTEAKHQRNCSAPSASQRCLGTCEGLWAPVARAYNLTELSVRQTHNTSRVRWHRGVHPDAAGHYAMAGLVARELVRRAQITASSQSAAAGGDGGGAHVHAHAVSQPAWHRPARPAFLDATWEQPDVPWACGTCDWHGCVGLPPVQNDGFVLAGDAAVLARRTLGNVSVQSDGHVRKFGWSSAKAGASISFALPARGGGAAATDRSAGAATGSAGADASGAVHDHHVAMALLCSYGPTVGIAAIDVLVLPTDCVGGSAPKAARAPSSSSLLRARTSAWCESRTRRAAALVVDLCWPSQTTQQCVIDLGRVDGVGGSDAAASAPPQAGAMTPTMTLVRVRVATASEARSVPSTCNRSLEASPSTLDREQTDASASVAAPRGWPSAEVKVFGVYHQEGGTRAGEARAQQAGAADDESAAAAADAGPWPSAQPHDAAAATRKSEAEGRAPGPGSRVARAQAHENRLRFRVRKQ